MPWIPTLPQISLCVYRWVGEIYSGHKGWAGSYSITAHGLGALVFPWWSLTSGEFHQRQGSDKGTAMFTEELIIELSFNFSSFH